MEKAPNRRLITQLRAAAILESGLLDQGIAGRFPTTNTYFDLQMGSRRVYRPIAAKAFGHLSSLDT